MYKHLDYKKTKKDYTLAGRIDRMLKPFHQIRKLESDIKFDWRTLWNYSIDIQIKKDYKKKEYSISLDPWIDSKFIGRLGVSVEGHKTWKETKEIFLGLVYDNFDRMFDHGESKYA